MVAMPAMVDHAATIGTTVVSERRPNDAAIARAVVSRRVPAAVVRSSVSAPRIGIVSAIVGRRRIASVIAIAWIAVTRPVTVCRRGNAADHGAGDQTSSDSRAKATTPPVGFGGARCRHGAEAEHGCCYYNKCCLLHLMASSIRFSVEL